MDLMRAVPFRIGDVVRVPSMGAVGVIDHFLHLDPSVMVKVRIGSLPGLTQIEVGDMEYMSHD